MNGDGGLGLGEQQWRMERNGRIWEAEVIRLLMGWMWGFHERKEPRTTLRLWPEAGGQCSCIFIYMGRRESGDNEKKPRVLDMLDLTNLLAVQREVSSRLLEMQSHKRLLLTVLLQKMSKGLKIP